MKGLKSLEEVGSHCDLASMQILLTLTQHLVCLGRLLQFIGQSIGIGHIAQPICFHAKGDVVGILFFDSPTP